jgi:glc operon protein GlcG
MGFYRSGEIRKISACWPAKKGPWQTRGNERRTIMLSRFLALAIMAAILMGFASGAAAQQMPNPYGTAISLEVAKKAAAAAAAEALKNKWRMAIAITDPAGHLVYFEKIDGTQTASIWIAIAKSRSAAIYKRPTKTFQDAVAGGNPSSLAMKGAVPSEGGLPILMDGKIVGGIGASGGTSQQDGIAAKAGADAVK